MAGIRPVMITGDHPLTAWQIAASWISSRRGGQGRLLTGVQLSRMSDAELNEAVAQVSVYAASRQSTSFASCGHCKARAKSSP